MTQSAFQSYDQFWPFYLSQHSRTLTRQLHIAGLFLAGAIGAACVLSGHPIWLPLALVGGYGPAWFSHFFIEKNRPATFGHPFWSFVSDFRMAYLTLTGKL